ncbi:MAG: FAD-dependent oxidoreductase, partial [Nitrosomonadales bacterium]|nr:FAD-dependent oxidoreductase [Nitrosomonadales bacterium]MBT7407987.1 FAD-dependent oxidoreductase [Nitrosomonadales bacterium]
MNKNNFNVLIIGSGLAGLATALKLADKKSIGIVCKTNLTESSSHWAQGGISAAISSKDPISSHISDTKIAGAGLCNEAITEFVVNNSEKALDWLIKIG